MRVTRITGAFPADDQGTLFDDMDDVAALAVAERLMQVAACNLAERIGHDESAYLLALAAEVRRIADDVSSSGAEGRQSARVLN